MNLEQIAETRWANATIRDNFVFGKTMELYPDLCRRLLELILNVRISEISYPEREKTVEACIDGKGIRLDVYVEERGAKRSFDVEMQLTDSDNLAKRMRYYQSLIDTDKLKRGQHYSALGETFIIFICTFDRFKQGRHLYTFQERCAEDLNLLLNDGATKIFLNTKGTTDDVSPDIKAFLSYVDSGIVSGKFVEELDAAVDSVKLNTKARHDFMTLQMALLESKMEGELQGEERGLKRGFAEGTESVALRLIRMGLKFADIQKATDLPIQRLEQLEQLANDNRNI